jgi:methylisocitrate lyase
MGYKIVIWPVSSLRVSAKAVERLYDAIQRDGGAQNCLDAMQTRAELYETIGYQTFESLDKSIIASL